MPTPTETADYCFHLHQRQRDNAIDALRTVVSVATRELKALEASRDKGPDEAVAYSVTDFLETPAQRYHDALVGIVALRQTIGVTRRAAEEAAQIPTLAPTDASILLDVLFSDTHTRSGEAIEAIRERIVPFLQTAAGSVR